MIYLIFKQVKGAEDASTVIRVADEQMYAAKCAGRNRVEFKIEGEEQVPVIQLAN